MWAQPNRCRPGATPSPRRNRHCRPGVPTDTRALRDYPLYPYLRYQELSRRPAEVPAAEVREFLQSYADSPLADRLRSAWLRQLAQTRRWDDYLQDAAQQRCRTGMWTAAGSVEY